MGAETAIVGTMLMEEAAMLGVAEMVGAAAVETAVGGAVIGGLAEEAAALGVGELAGGGVAGEAIGGSMLAEEAAALGVGDLVGASATELVGGGAIEEAAALGINETGSAIGANPAAVEFGTKPVESVAQQAAKRVLNGEDPTKPKGLIDSVTDWAKSKSGGMVLGQTAMGALQGAGAGMGAKEAAKTKAESDSRLLAQQTEEKLRMSREGTYTGGAVTPSGQKVLRRADGSLVYAPNGLISNAMR